MISFPWILFIVTSSVLTSLPDASPSLFLYDKLFANENVFKKKFHGKRIWVTGASSGIGAEITQQLHSYGAKLIISARREEELHKVKLLCEKKSHVSFGFRKDGDAHATPTPFEISVLPFDMTDTDEKLSTVVSTALEFHKGIDILLLNAGAGQLSPAMNDSVSTTRSLMELNFMGPARLAMEVIQQDQWGKEKYDQIHSNTNGTTRRKGHIVVTSSIASKMALPLGTSYAASKHAVHGFFTSLRSECAEWLRVDLPCPGPISTRFQDNVLKNHNSVRLSGAVHSSKEQQQQQDDDSELKMSVERCARLILSAMIGPSFIMQETWISRQPTLSFMFVNQYFPNVSNFLLGKIGPLRLKAYNAGLPLYKISSWKKVAQMEKIQTSQTKEINKKETENKRYLVAEDKEL